MSAARVDSVRAGAEPIFYFDFSSPFAYLAATRIDSLLPRTPRWAPISMAFVISAHERTPWSMREESIERNFEAGDRASDPRRGVRCPYRARRQRDLLGGRPPGRGG